MLNILQPQLLDIVPSSKIALKSSTDSFISMGGANSAGLYRLVCAGWKRSIMNVYTLYLQPITLPLANPHLSLVLNMCLFLRFSVCLLFLNFSKRFMTLCLKIIL